MSGNFGDSLDQVEILLALEEAFPDLDIAQLSAEELERLIKRFLGQPDDEAENSLKQ
jgi:acyl carrier protein